ncbi:MAG: lytic transglycosylase domain-containing protein [Candidatus Margulisiibacteriota bacterium]
MDTAAVIAILFAVSILTSLGGHNNPAPKPQLPSIIYQEVNVQQPAGTFDVSDEAEVKASIQKYVLKYRPPEEADEISNCIVRYSQNYNVNPKLAAALFARESRFNPKATSSSGAKGIGQLLPSTAKGLNIDDAYNIDENIKGSVRYLKSMLDRFGGKASDALAAYFQGPNAVSRQGGFSAETKLYVEDILKLYQKI